MFIETIRIENQKIENLNLHQNRLFNTQKYFYKNFEPINLNKIINPQKNSSLYTIKCKIVYNYKLIDIKYIKYTPRKINSLALIHNNNIYYKYKFYNRNIIDKLILKNYDDILIAKNNFITDTSFSNIVFFDGKNYFTPTTYLLNGTQRQLLINKKIIKTKIITTENIKDFKEAFLINAMLNWQNKIKININNIINPIKNL